MTRARRLPTTRPHSGAYAVARPELDRAVEPPLRDDEDTSSAMYRVHGARPRRPTSSGSSSTVRGRRFLAEVDVHRGLAARRPASPHRAGRAGRRPGAGGGGPPLGRRRGHVAPQRVPAAILRSSTTDSGSVVDDRAVCRAGSGTRRLRAGSTASRRSSARACSAGSSRITQILGACPGFLGSFEFKVDKERQAAWWEGSPSSHLTGRALLR